MHTCTVADMIEWKGQEELLQSSLQANERLRLRGKEGKIQSRTRQDLRYKLSVARGIQYVRCGVPIMSTVFDLPLAQAIIISALGDNMKTLRAVEMFPVCSQGVFQWEVTIREFQKQTSMVHTRELFMVGQAKTGELTNLVNAFIEGDINVWDILVIVDSLAIKDKT